MKERVTGLLLAALALLAFTSSSLAAQRPTLNPVSAGHNQALTVTVTSYSATVATVEGWVRTSAGWRRELGPWSAHVGRNGVARAGAKREGDGRTPSGVFSIPFAFGVKANPGVHVPWHTVTGSWIVWDDDSASSRYNLWSDIRFQHAGRSPEALHITPVYDVAAAIGYNPSRQPGLGSAIFVHVSQNKATSGCISLPELQVRAIVRWLQPALHPVVSLGSA